MCKTKVPKLVWTPSDTFSKFRDPKIWFQEYTDLFDNAGQVLRTSSGFHSVNKFASIVPNNADISWGNPYMLFLGCSCLP